MDAWRIVELADHPSLGTCLDSFHILSVGSDHGRLLLPAGLTNRRYLSGELKLGGYRLGIMAFAILLLGVTSTIVAIDQIGNLI